MSEKKGYGIVIPNDWKIGKWNKLTAQEIVHQLKELNRDAFYSMAANVGIDLALLDKSGSLTLRFFKCGCKTSHTPQTTGRRQKFMICLCVKLWQSNLLSYGIMTGFFQILH